MGLSTEELDVDQQQDHIKQKQQLLQNQHPASAASAGSSEEKEDQQQHEAAAAKQQQQVTWRRLHAMGPRNLLPQQIELGLLPSLSTTQWPLEFEAETSMAGQTPIMAVPSFSQPQPYPLVLMQQATAAAGGGVVVHVWLDGSEVGLIKDAVAAQGGI